MKGRIKATGKATGDYPFGMLGFKSSLTCLDGILAPHASDNDPHTRYCGYPCLKRTGFVRHREKDQA